MSIHLQRDLEHLQRNLLAMAAAVEDAVHKAIHSLRDRNVQIAESVVEGDSQIDQDENYIENECLKILALHQPVAVDLRRIAAALKINNELERMADLAEDIAERAIHLAEQSPISIPHRLQSMTDLTSTMVRESLDAFVQMDARQARRICRLDDQVDELNEQIIKELIELMQASPEMVSPGLSLFSATRHLERIADHATNIAEDVIYLVEGEIVRHRPAAMRVEE